jgi:hypothetical protein
MFGFGRKRPSPEGTVIKAFNGVLIVLGKNGKERTVAVANDAKITLNGAACQLEDLTEGAHVKLTPRREDQRPVIVEIEATSV